MPIDKNNKETTSVTLSKNVIQELDTISEATGISKSQLIELAVRCQPCYEGLKRGIDQMKENSK